MTNDPDMATALVGGSYEARKGAVRRDGSAVEVRVRAVRWRNWSTEDKLRIVRETLEPGAVAKVVADRHGISTGLLFAWRKEMLATAVSGFMPVEVVSEVPKLEPPSASTSPAAVDTAGTLELVLPCGATVRIIGQVDVALLRTVLAELGGG